jgi:hypothetical protein
MRQDSVNKIVNQEIDEIKQTAKADRIAGQSSMLAVSAQAKLREGHSQ